MGVKLYDFSPNKEEDIQQQQPKLKAKRNEAAPEERNNNKIHTYTRLTHETGAYSFIQDGVGKGQEVEGERGLEEGGWGTN